jgi:Ti-type conjugative transfer relaxase TraA
MLSIAAISGDQGAYYTGLAQEDYYLEGGEPPGHWLGQGAQILGLSDLIDKEQFSRLFAGFLRDGDALVQNAGDPGRQAGWDLTFSAPKSVSALWSQLPANLGAEIRAAHDAAVKAACGYLEEQAGWTRRGKGGAIREKAGLLMGLFEHGTSRAGDPQLHTHALLFNIGVRADGTTGTVESRGLYQHKMAAGALYRTELAAQLRERLGLKTERVGTWFEVKHVSKKLMEHWSTRRKEIEAALLESGFSGARAAEVAALDTRHAKQHVARDHLFSKWREIGTLFGWGREQAEALCHDRSTFRPQPSLLQQSSMIRDSVAELTAQQSSFAEKDLVRKLAERGQEHGFGAKEILEMARRFLQERAIELGQKNGCVLYTTQEMLEREQSLLAKMTSRVEDRRHVVKEKTVERILGKHHILNEEQRNAVRHITMETGGVAVVSGMAGTGKTTMLKAAAEVWRAAGFSVMGAALAGKAADGLIIEAGIDSATIAKTLFLAEKSHNPFSGIKNPFTKHTVLVVDEAGMVDTRNMERLLHEAERSGAKLVLVGDARQLQPVEAGGPFASIAARVGQAALTSIVRQREEWARQAVHDVADGHSGSALSAFAERGLLTVADTKSQARTALLQEWQKASGLEKPEHNLILAASNKDAATINREAQVLRKNSRELGRLFLTAGGERFHKADRILFTKNSGPRGVRNGQIGTVTHVDCIASTLYVKLDNGRKVQVPVKEYSHVKLGYAVTTHKAQGMTAENAFILTDASMQDKELSYVQTSRARGTTRLFTTKAEAGPDLKDLSKRMQESHQKGLAADLLKEPQSPEKALDEHKRRQTLGQRLGHRLGLTP